MLHKLFKKHWFVPGAEGYDGMTWVTYCKTCRELAEKRAL